VSALGPLRQVAQILSQRGIKVPSSLRRGIATAERAPEGQHPRLAAAVAELHAPLRPLVSWEGPLCPAYPRAIPAHAARLALGEPPVRILRGLTPREAHEALSAGFADPIAWILRGDVAVHGVRSVAVARWIAACWADPKRRAALETERTERVAGVDVRGRLVDRVDEITPADLERGPATGVQPAFAAAAARLYSEWEESAKDDERPLNTAPRWWKSVRCAHVLLTRKALCAEGKAMAHCVGTYAPYVQSGRSVIVSIVIRVREDLYRSTVELDRSGPPTVRQHKGIANAAAPPVCVRALDVLLRRWSLPASGGAP
jgi:hypothetical protein